MSQIETVASYRFPAKKGQHSRLLRLVNVPPGRTAVVRDVKYDGPQVALIDTEADPTHRWFARGKDALEACEGLPEEFVDQVRALTLPSGKTAPAESEDQRAEEKAKAEAEEKRIADAAKAEEESKAAEQKRIADEAKEKAKAERKAKAAAKAKERREAKAKAEAEAAAKAEAEKAGADANEEAGGDDSKPENA